MEGGEGKQRWISTVINNSARAAAAAVSACACVLLCCLKDVSLSPSPLPPPGHSAQFVSGGIKKTLWGNSLFQIAKFCSCWRMLSSVQMISNSYIVIDETWSSVNKGSEWRAN